ncbi:MAG: NAD-dependent epimerase/dehydratase family protein [Bryobacterales bacterium]|nr:NAD-dependent epimerase/dehydratase family protein [Bryobacterales bacterium]
MGTVIVTGSSGLVGSECVRHFASRGFDVVGIDNDMRAQFFGDEASTREQGRRLEREFPNFRLVEADIRETLSISEVFADRSSAIELVIHAAAQPSHDWAARSPATDFTVNAYGTLNLLEAVRKHCPRAVFIFVSTNKVYGDTPNALPLVEQETRWEIPADHHYANGIDESMSIDQSKHSLFGVSKTAADLMVQEYGRYFGMHTACFRGGCLTGPAHRGAELHGFLSYLMSCTVTGKPYRIIGYKGKQVRDNIHSSDLAAAFECFYRRPGSGKVYNIGGARRNSCSVLEAVALCEKIAGKRLNVSYEDQSRQGDHMWWITDTSRFRADYPEWRPRFDLETTLTQIYEARAELELAKTS